MAPTLRSAIAPTFTWTSTGAGLDVIFTFAAGASPVGVTMPTGDYRVCLAPSASEFMAVLTAAINAAMAGAGRAETFYVTMGTDGRVSIDNNHTFTVTAYPALLLLGFDAKPTATLSAKAAYPPKYFATFVSRVSDGWKPRTPMATAETIAGVGYGITSAVTSWEDELALAFIPIDPTYRASLAVDQTSWEPGVTDLASYGSHAVPWGVADVLAVSLGKTVAAALGNFQTCLSVLSTQYDLVTIPGIELAAPRKARLRDGWDAYFTWTAKVIRQATTPTAVRT